VGLGGLHDQSLVDVRDNTTASDGGLDEGIELLVTADSELQVAGSNTLNFQVLGGIACKFENFSSQVLKDSSRVNS
jgi:hypothetical protein